MSEGTSVGDAREAERTKRMRLGASHGLLRQVVHDLLQPLNVMRCVAQDLRIDIKKHRLDVESLPNAMSEIEVAIDQVASQLRQLRSFTEPSLNGQLETVQIEDVCKAAISRFHTLEPSVGVSESYGAGIRVEVVVAALEQAILEVLDNAAHATHDAGRSHVPIRLQTVTDGSRVVVVVTDAGAGVPDGDRAKIFAPFFSRRTGAAGFGLPLADTLLQALGGEVKLASTSDGGSTFELVLPAPAEGA